MNAETWFGELLEKYRDDPEALTDELLLDITEQMYVCMRDRGMRPSELAKRLGVSRAFVSQLLNGKPNMTIRTLVGVAHALGQRVTVELRPATADRGRLDEYTEHVPVLSGLAETVDVSGLAA